MSNLTAKQLRDILDYDPETGEFVWLSGRRAGMEAGCLTKDGYRQIKIGGRTFYAHRLAWLYVHGEWPAHLDHRDGNRRNNCIGNLRHATAAENAQNRIVYRTNKSGYQGVTLVDGRYLAQIMAGGVHVRLGLCDDPTAAHELYLAAKAKLHRFQPEPRAV